MTPVLRPYQHEISGSIHRAWADGFKVVCAVLPPGAGKTITFGNAITHEPGVVFAIAHRQELIFQISMALAKFGVVHNIQATKESIKWAVRLHIEAFGRHYFDPNARVFLTGIKTLLNRQRELQRAIKQTKLWVIDECHHITKNTEWGTGVSLFPESCRGLGVTATPLRADGQGLGRHADGFCDIMIVGPSMRELIVMDYLTEYRIFAPKTDIDLSNVPITATGDFSTPKMVASVRKSRIVGDVVQHYLRIAPGKIGVTFVPDIETGREMTANFIGSGVPTAMIHAKTPPKERQQSIAALARGDLKEIVNVDIFGEGFDLPAIEVVSFGRPTCSYGLYVQQFGRGLRLLPGKDYGIIIDHVGNVMRHGLPDAPVQWSLDARERRQGIDRTEGLIPLRTCIKCTGVYEAFREICPYCGQPYKPEGRASIEQVDGDLLELSPEVLAAMRGEIERIDSPESTVGNKMRHAGAPEMAIAGAMKNHRVRREAQEELRAVIALWAGYQRAAKIPDKVSYRKFNSLFGIDVLGAQALGRKDAEILTGKIKEVLI